MSIDYSIYEDLNDIPQKTKKDNIIIDPKTLPSWMISVADNVIISREARANCVYRIILNYLESEQLRKLTRRYEILFVGGEYVGIYKNTETAIEKWRKVKKGDETFFIIPMYEDIVGMEKKEISMFSSAKIIKSKNKNGETQTSVNYSKFIADVKLIGELKNEESGDLPSEKMIIDTGCTITHLPNTKYFDYKICKYNKFPYDHENNEIVDVKLENENFLI